MTILIILVGIIACVVFPPLGFFLLGIVIFASGAIVLSQPEFWIILSIMFAIGLVLYLAGKPKRDEAAQKAKEEAARKAEAEKKAQEEAARKAQLEATEKAEKALKEKQLDFYNRCIETKLNPNSETDVSNLTIFGETFGYKTISEIREAYSAGEQYSEAKNQNQIKQERLNQLLDYRRYQELAEIVGREKYLHPEKFGCSERLSSDTIDYLNKLMVDVSNQDEYFSYLEFSTPKIELLSTGNVKITTTATPTKDIRILDKPAFIDGSLSINILDGKNVVAKGIYSAPRGGRYKLLGLAGPKYVEMGDIFKRRLENGADTESLFGFPFPDKPIVCGIKGWYTEARTFSAICISDTKLANADDLRVEFEPLHIWATEMSFFD